MADPTTLPPLPPFDQLIADPGSGRANLYWYNWFRGLELLFRNPDVPVVAPANASYLVVGLSGTLSAERVITAGAGISITDGGANGALTIAVAGGAAQVLQATYAVNADLTVAIPYDDTVPLSTEGTQILAQAITPQSAANKVLVEVVVNGAVATANDTLTVALFRGTTCIGVQGASMTLSGFLSNISFNVLDAPATTSPVTYSVRVGGGTGTVRLNGRHDGRKWGGASICTLTLSEIK